MTQITRPGEARGDHLGDQVADHIGGSRIKYSGRPWR
jgi:hypothetical protein